MSQEYKVDADFAQLEVDSDEDYRTAAVIHDILMAAYGSVDQGLLRKAFEHRNDQELENINDYYYLVLKTVMEEKPITKNAYPLSGSWPELASEFDMKKWSKMVHKIYDAVLKGEMSFEAASDYYSGFLDRKSGEDLKFKKWLKYYKDGEHLKYSNEEEEMKKSGLYQFSPHGIDFYYGEEEPIISPEKDIADTENELQKSEDYREWKQKLNAAIRRIDKLLRMSEDQDFVDPDKYEELRDLLHKFDIQVGKVRLQSTASDLTYQMAGNLNKMGFAELSDDLIKIAQEAPPVDQPIPDEDVPSPVGTPEQQLEEAGVPEEAPKVSEKLDKIPPVSPRDIEPEAGVKPGEYEKLNSDVSINDANEKLEEVAGVLADRRVIRLLAEFDIMLDKIGIASMFSELPEAQSRLIEAYSYAMTRVSKMLGMLSSGRSLLEAASGGAPGEAGEVEEAVEEAPAPEAITEEFGPEEEGTP